MFCTLFIKQPACVLYCSMYLKQIWIKESFRYNGVKLGKWLLFFSANERQCNCLLSPILHKYSPLWCSAHPYFIPKKLLDQLQTLHESGCISLWKFILMKVCANDIQCLQRLRALELGLYSTVFKALSLVTTEMKKETKLSKYFMGNGQFGFFFFTNFYMVSKYFI